jgi:PAH dioxygenase large subunit
MASTSPTATASIDELLLDAKLSLESGMIPARIFNDPELHRQELERVFARAWCFVGHESEIPSPGDYVLRYVANDPFIFVRGEDGVVRVLFDACRHRGMRVCRAEKGNASHFRCSYHGWTYRNTGDFVGAPEFQAAYFGLDRADWGLLAPAQTAIMQGFVFMTMNEDAPSFDDYLGDARWYLDTILGFHKDGLVAVGDPQRWLAGGNWKTGVENFTGDDYHVISLHRSVLDLVSVEEEVVLNAYHVQAGNGHTIQMTLADTPLRSLAELGEGVPPELLDVAERLKFMQVVVFPNCVFSFALLPPSMIAVLSVGVWHPKASDNTELSRVMILPRGYSDDEMKKAYRGLIGQAGPAGLVEQDDTEPWSAIARTAGTLFARQTNFKLNLQMGMPGIGTAQRVKNWPGPGVAVEPRFEESGARSFYNYYLHCMLNGGEPMSAEDTAIVALVPDERAPDAPSIGTHKF